MLAANLSAGGTEDHEISLHFERDMHSHFGHAEIASRIDDMRQIMKSNAGNGSLQYHGWGWFHHEWGAHGKMSL
jgi:hypothetical protein